MFGVAIAAEGGELKTTGIEEGVEGGEDTKGECAVQIAN